MRRIDDDMLYKAFGRLFESVGEARSLDPQVGMLHADSVKAALGEAEFERLNDRLRRVSLLMQVDALSRLLIEVVYPSLVREREDGLLGSVADEMHGGGEFPNIRVLRSLLENSGAAGSVPDVLQGLHELLSSCEHDSSPDCPARVPDARDTTDFRRRTGGCSDTARHDPSPEPVDAGAVTVTVVPDLGRFRQLLKELLDVLNHYSDDPVNLAAQSAQSGS